MGNLVLALRGAIIAGALSFLFPIAGAWACSGLTSISPTSGPAGTVVTLTGSGFNFGCIGLQQVTFGSTIAGSLNVIDDTTATVVAPAGSGTVDVTATIDNTPYTLSAAFTYTAGTDSQNLQTMLHATAKIVASASGDAISGAVSGAIGDAFSGGPALTGGTNGFALNFTAEARASDTQDAVRALAYAGEKNATAPALPGPTRDWSLWADARGSGFDRDDAFGTGGGQINLTAGLGRKLTPNLLIGVFGGYETFDYTMDSIGGKVTGDGGTIGGYAAARIGNAWRADAMVGWSAINYAGATGIASGATDGSRWLAAGGFTGSYRFGSATFEPSARVTALWEHDAAWTDNQAITQAAGDFSVGRLSFGGKVIVPWPSSDARISTYVGLYGDERFSSDTVLLPAGAPDVGIEDGLSGRLTAGISAGLSGGAALSLGGELGGIGGGYDYWSAEARAALPF